MAQSEYGKIDIKEDFFGVEHLVASTTAPPIQLGAYFQVIGQGIADTDSGAPALDSDGLNGVVQLTTTNEDLHSAGIATAVMFDVALMAPMSFETRVRFTDLDTKEFFYGLTDANTASGVQIIEGEIGHGATTTLTLTASDICGFLLSAELTEDEMWHSIYNGGSTTGVTLSTTNELVTNAVAGEYNVLKMEIDPDGTARFYVDGVLRQTVTGAVSTTVDQRLVLMVEAKSAAIESVDVDYVGIKANRDWTV